MANTRASTRVRAKGKSTGKIYEGMGVLSSANKSRRLPHPQMEDIAKANRQRIAKAKQEVPIAKANFEAILNAYAKQPTTFLEKDLKDAAVAYGTAKYHVHWLESNARWEGTQDAIDLRRINQSAFRNFRTNYKRTH